MVTAPIAQARSLDLHPLASGFPPPWASGWGEDENAPWASITVNEKSIRLRWIPAGRFLMGSPEAEVGRFEDEAPQREMTIDCGFWMFATPCTQEFWEAMMGQNPSRFRSPTRPVEQVSWDDCQEFLKRLNDRLEGLMLSLPSEAQWESACRAGTTTATYAGDLEFLGESNAPVLDGIAWYRGNCGLDFDLPEGFDMSSWHEKQYDFAHGGTRPVGQKRSNAWGLHDMLGNVWEWCADPYLEHVGGGAFVGHMIRGGSWSSHAHVVRASCRGRSVPSDREVYLGFRCAEYREGIVAEEVQSGSACEP
jgi:formylglycine-generating enzyme required for sulfatase activity